MYNGSGVVEKGGKGGCSPYENNYGGPKIICSCMQNTLIEQSRLMSLYIFLEKQCGKLKLYAVIILV